MKTYATILIAALVMLSACIAPPSQAAGAKQSATVATASPQEEAVDQAGAQAEAVVQEAAGQEQADADIESPVEPVTADDAAECPICDWDATGYTGPLDANEIHGLLLALNDEYHAVAVYSQVLDDFGEIRPFVNILGAENTHIGALVNLFDAYDVPVPENPWMGQIDSFATVQAACETGVAAEILNRDLYARLFDTTDRPDITQVYTALQRASEEKHLPAFQRCAS